MPHTPTEQTILKLGSEGGCIELVGCQTGEIWRFRVATQETILRALEKDESPLEATAPSWFDTWAEALEALDAYSWQELQPLVVNEPHERQDTVSPLR